MKRNGGIGRSGKSASARPRPLAKIDPPRLSDIYQRERIFSQLDGYADRRVIWLSAPPGYGKTVAVASWLQSRSSTVIWYQCDEGDADIASFFYFLSLAHANCVKLKNDALPALSPDLYPALPAFVRNYFREFCVRLTAPTFVVLDNWQDIPNDAPLREMLPIAIGELPAGVSLLVISRQEPPPNLSRLSCSEQMARLDWADLKLTEQETADIAARYQPAHGQKVMPARDLYAVTQGWAVGLAVMLHHESSHRVTQFDVGESAVQAVFDYLTSEVFDRLGDTVKDFLLKTSYLEHITVAVAAQLTGVAAAREILDALIRNNAFTLHRPGSATYHYHPLFRQLLRSRAAARFSDAEQHELLTSAANILAQNDDPEMAFDLLIQAQRWQEGAQLIMRMAPTLLLQGRFKTLSVWIEALPERLQIDSPWLTYWRGTAQMAIDFPAAAPTLEHAYQLFAQQKDELGQLLAIAGILQQYHISYTAVGCMVPWIGILVDLLETHPRFPSLGVELSVLTGLFSAILLADQRNPRLTPSRERIIELMQSDVDVQSKASATVALMSYFAVSGDIVQWRKVFPDFEYALDSTRLGPALRIQILWMHAYQFQLTGETERCFSLLDIALNIARQHHLPFFAARLILAKLQAKDYATNAAELSDGLTRLEPELAQAPLLMRVQFKYVNAMFRLAQGDLKAATREIESADAAMVESGYELAWIIVLVGKGEIMCESGRLSDAAECLARCEKLLGGLRFPLLDFNMGLVKAEIARKQAKHAEFIEALTAVLTIGREQGFANGFHAYPVILPRLVPYALENDIEVAYCRWLIRKRNFQPPAHDVTNWPWPIRVYALGAFRVEVDDRMLEIRGKAQRKPLNLLKSLLLARDGVEIGQLMDRFWPDLEGDAARNAFDLAVHRLRKLLKHRHAVAVTHGRLALNRNAVWVDAFALDAIAEPTQSEEMAAERTRRLLRLYRGAFLADETESWIFAVRERVRSKFLRCVEQLVDVLTASHSYDALSDFYQHVLEIEPLAEPFYRGFMRCLIAQGHHAEAVRVYQRCDEVLSAMLRAQPSPPTRDLYAWLLKR